MAPNGVAEADVHRRSKVHNHVATERQSGDFGSEFDDGFLQHVVEVGRDQPSTRQLFFHIPEILSVWVEFFRSSGDVTPFATLRVGMLGAPLQEGGIVPGEFG